MKKRTMVAGCAAAALAFALASTGCPASGGEDWETTAAPGVVNASARMTAAGQRSVSFTVTGAAAGAWAVYDRASGGSPLSGVSAACDGAVLTLSAAGDGGLPAGTYYAAVTEDGKLESPRVELLVLPYIDPSLAFASFYNEELARVGALLKARYDDEGGRIGDKVKPIYTALTGRLGAVTDSGDVSEALKGTLAGRAFVWESINAVKNPGKQAEAGQGDEAATWEYLMEAVDTAVYGEAVYYSSYTDSPVTKKQLVDKDAVAAAAALIPGAYAVSRQAVWDAVNAKKATGRGPEAGTAAQAADWAYLLAALDAANGEALPYDAFTYTASLAVDAEALAALCAFIVTGNAADNAASLASRQAVWDAVNACKPTGKGPETGTSSQAADWAYMLAAVDAGNYGASSYGAFSYATPAAVDMEALEASLDLILSGTYIAVGTSNRIACSTDGAHWVLVDTALPSSGGGKKSVVYGAAGGKGRFAVTGYDARYGSLGTVTGSRGFAAWSADGVSWTEVSLPDNTAWAGIAYGGGVFVTVGGGAGDGSAGKAAWSPDGEVWTEAALPASGSGTAAWAAVAYGGGVFAALGNGESAAWSPDGKTWTAAALPPGGAWTDIAYGNGVFTAVGEGARAAWSTDGGKTWTASVTEVSPQNFVNLVAYGAGLFVEARNNAFAAGQSAGASSWSPDGASWQRGEALSCQALSYGGGRFVAVNSTELAAFSASRSPDGKTWSWSASVFPGAATCGQITGLAYKE